MDIPKFTIKVPNFKIYLRPKDVVSILSKTKEVLKSDYWTSSTFNIAFENAFKKYTGVAYAAAVANGGAGLVVILQALEIPEGSLVICPTLTAPPTPHAILAAGMRVVFVDSSQKDLNLDLDDVERKFKTYRGKVKAVIAVHLGGWISPNIHELNSLCKRYGAYLIEDCAHAAGSRLNGKPAGSTGIAAVYSFFMTKPLTSGEGGMVASRDKNLIDAAKIIRNYGKDDKGRHIRKGFNYKLSEFNAAVALWAVENANRIIKDRQKMAAVYDRLLSDLEGARIFKIPKVSCSYYKYILVLDKRLNRDKFKKILLKNYGIEVAGGVYDCLCHQEPYFRSVPARVLNAGEKFPSAEEFSKRQVCLPLYLGLKRKEQEYVARSVSLTLKKCLRTSAYKI